MAYKITQHRRGTYEEWLALDVAPYEGELVIVEFDNNVRKCKIGDGETPFSKLPYLSDWVVAEFEDKLDTLQELTGNALLNAVAEIDQKIANAYDNLSNDITTLRSDVGVQISVLSSDIEGLAADLSKVDGVVKTLVEPAVGELDAKYSEELNSITEQHNTDVAILSTTINNKVAELTSYVDTSVAKNTSDFTDALLRAKTDLAVDYIDKIAEAESRLQEEIQASEATLQQHSSTIDNIQSTVVDLADSINSRIDEKVVASETAINTSLNEIREAIGQVYLTIDELKNNSNNKYEEDLPEFDIGPSQPAIDSETISALVDQIDDIQYKVTLLESTATTSNSDIQRINLELIRLAASLTSIVEQQKTSSDLLTKTVSDLDSRLSRADTEFVASMASQSAEFSNEISKLTAADLLLYQRLYKVQDELIKKIETGDASIQAELNADIIRINQSISDMKDKLNTRLTSVQESLVDGQTSVKAELTKKIDNLEKVQNIKISKNTADITALNTTVAANQTNTSNVIDTILSDIASNKTNITNNTLAINRVSSDLDSKTAIIGANVTALGTKLDTQLAAAEVRLQSQISAVDSSVQQQAEILTDVKDKVNDLVEDFDHKVDTKIADSKVDTDDKIIQVRESIRQIELILDILQNSSSGSSIDHESLSALVEELTALNIKVQTLEKNNASNEIYKQTVNTELVRLATLLTDIVDTHAANVDNLNKSINDLDVRLSAANADVIASTTTNFELINDKLVGLYADDALLYQIIYRIRDELINSATSADNSIIAELSEYKSEVTKNLNSVANTFNDKLTEAQNTINNRITALDSKVTKEVNALYTTHSNKISKNEKAIADLAGIVNSNKVEVINDFEEINKKINTNKVSISSNASAIKKIDEELDNKVNILNTTIGTLNGQIEAQSNRISSIIALENGSTTGDAELLDIRSGYDGKMHTSAGNAVRAVGNDLKTLSNSVQTLKNSLSQYIDTQAIDGLHYDYTGEVGLMQPYMLYLKAGDDIIQDSGVQIISGAGGGGGASTASTLKIGYITQSPVVVTPADKAKIYFTFSGTDSSGDAILQASATWRVNGSIVEHGTVRDGENEFDATKYLNVGTTKLSLTVTDDNGSVVTKQWSIQQIELTISSSFNDKRKYSIGEKIIFDYIPSGSVKKTAIFKLDGITLSPVVLEKEISGSTVSYEIPAQAHGAHILEVYLEADINGMTTQSNHIFKDIIWFDNSSNIPVIGTTAQNLAVKQYSTTNIIYTVYDPNNETPNIDIEIDGKIVSSTTVQTNKDYGDTPTAVYSYIATDVGAHVIKIICGNTQKIINTFVEDIGLSISPVTAGLVFDFNPVGYSNGDSNRLWSYDDIHMTVSDNFDWINGGYLPSESDGPCFCIKAGSTATIDYKLFENEAKISGKEFKLIFKTKNVANPDAVFLSCLDNITDKDHIGVEMGVHAAHVYGKSGNLELAYSEEDVIEFEFNISKDTEAVPMVMGYEDGVPSRPMVYGSSHSFKQNTPKVITLGSPDCDLYIYRFKVYDTSLSAVSILRNFIADARTVDEMIARHDRNQIYDENQKLTAEVLAEKCPWLRVYKVSAPHFTNSKSDKVSDTTIQQIYRGGDPILDNWIAYNSQHSGQGTSSNNYGAAGRNLDFIMNKSSSYFELGDGTIANEITLTRNSVPIAYLNAKVNIASSNNLTNAILANRYNQFNPYKRPFVREEGYDISKIKDTMEFYNCVIFIQETDSDLTTHREFADTDWHFYAIGNIGDSKKTDETRLTDREDPYECCVEIMDVGLPLSAFPRDTMINAMDYAIDEKTNERIYTWAKDDNLSILYEKQEDGSYELTSDTTIDYDKTYYVDILLHDDFSEDFTYGWRYISDDEDADIVATCKQAWIDFYRFVTTSSDEDFKEHLKDYFVVDSALYYYLFTTRYCMVDNRAKNTFWHYSKTADGTRRWDLNWDYDNDTSLGLNNFGKQLYRYGLEDIDVDDAGKEVFRQSNSLFFCRIRDLFASELKQMYQTLESKDAWNANAFINQCDEWQEQFPEELWRIDIERKYIRTYNKSFINSGGDTQFLVNMANGKMKYHRRQWERGQEQYMASKYQTTTALGDKYHANFRVSQFTEGETDNFVIPTNYQFTLTPYSYIYLNVYYNSGSPISVRVTDQNINTPIVVPYSRDKADIINVGSASAIRDFGDLAPLYADTVSVANATRIKRLKIGDRTEGYRNAGFSSLTTGSNNLLEELDLTNITSFTNTLDLRELINIKKLYASGTGIPGVIFAEGSKIEEAELPAINGLTLKNLRYLDAAKLQLDSYDNIIDLTVENCPLINQLSLLESSNKVTKVKLDNVHFGTKTYEYFENSIFKLKGIDETATNAQLAGSVHFDTLSGAQYNELKTRYPNLVVTYNTLTSTITFMDTDLESVLYSTTIMNGGDCQDPTYLDNWIEPVKAATPEFTYSWFGWSDTQNVIVNYEMLGDSADEVEQADYVEYRVNSIQHVEGDRVLYPVFKAIRNSYKVQFINPTNNNEVLYSTMVLYGSDAVYVGNDPQKLDTLTPSLYYFLGWSPSPDNITGELDCYAQFAILDETWYTINLPDITDCPDYSGNVSNGYKLNMANNTMSITSCKNKLNKAVKIPAQFEVNGTNYTVTIVGGFRDHDNIELISLPETLQEISAHGFYSCNYLNELTIPNSVVNIGASAFQGCTSIDEIAIPRNVSRIGDAAFAECTRLGRIIVDENNKYYTTLQDGQLLLETNTGKLIQGLSNSILTSNMSEIRSIGEYCFAYTNITRASLPEGLTTLASNAFSHCEALTSLTLPSTLTKVNATCFAWCRKLANVELNQGLIDIDTFAFNSCAFETVEIPNTVNYVRAQSFGSIPTLKSVTFKARINADGSVFVPDINKLAFSGAGTKENPIVFNLPWTEQQHNSYFTGVDSDDAAKHPGFGASHYSLNFI